MYPFCPGHISSIQTTKKSDERTRMQNIYQIDSIGSIVVCTLGQLVYHVHTWQLHNSLYLINQITRLQCVSIFIFFDVSCCVFHHRTSSSTPADQVLTEPCVRGPRSSKPTWPRSSAGTLRPTWMTARLWWWSYLKVTLLTECPMRGKRFKMQEAELKQSAGRSGAPPSDPRLICNLLSIFLVRWFPLVVGLKMCLFDRLAGTSSTLSSKCNIFLNNKDDSWNVA